MLTRALNALARLYQPDPFRLRWDTRAVTLADLQAACRWPDLVRECSLPAEATPLSLAQLRFSRVFPEMFLRRTPDGATVVLTLQEAAAEVVAAARAAARPQAQPVRPAVAQGA